MERIILLEKSHTAALSKLKFELQRTRDELSKLKTQLKEMPKKSKFTLQNLQNICRYCSENCRKQVCKKRLCQSQRKIENQKNYISKKKRKIQSSISSESISV